MHAPNNARLRIIVVWEIDLSHLELTRFARVHYKPVMHCKLVSKLLSATH